MAKTRLAVIILTLIAVVSTWPAMASDTEKCFFDRQGFTLMYGRSVWTNVGPDPDVAYDWSGLGYVLDKDLTPWFAIETQLGAGYLRARHRGESFSAELRVLADLHYRWLFLQLGTGLARVFDADELPGLAETKMHSILCGTAGVRFPLGRGADAPELSLGYGVEHLSAISKRGRDGDTGWNAGGPRLTVTWPF